MTIIPIRGRLAALEKSIKGLTSGWKTRSLISDKSIIECGLDRNYIGYAIKSGQIAR